MDPQNIQAVVEVCVASLKDRRNRHLITEKYADLSEASRADIEQDIACWFSGFAVEVQLLDASYRCQPSKPYWCGTSTPLSASPARAAPAPTS